MKPILFNAEMVRAVLSGRKTQTRRLINPAPMSVLEHTAVSYYGSPSELLRAISAAGRKCPFGSVGDRLWVREKHAQADLPDGTPVVFYAADEESIVIGRDGANGDDFLIKKFSFTDVKPWVSKWTPSIHMPRWASRITLEVTGVRVERLQDISEADARAEGASCRRISSGDARMGVLDWWSFGADSQDRDIGGGITAKSGYELLWEKINGPGSWDANPWVWAVEFKRVE